MFVSATKGWNMIAEKANYDNQASKSNPCLRSWGADQHTIIYTDRCFEFIWSSILIYLVKDGNLTFPHQQVLLQLSLRKLEPVGFP